MLGIGTETIMNGSNVIEILLQIEQFKVDLNCPWNRSTMMDSFL